MGAPWRSLLAAPAPFPLPVRVEAFPALAPVRVRYPRPRVDDIPRAVREELDRLPAGDLRGRRVAVTAGSRGIARIPDILRAVVGWLRERGAEPVVGAAMGSHGGATSEGQRALLAHLGITEASVGAPVLTDMAVVEVGRTAGGMVAYCDAAAASCDAILVVNRIKPHTAFAGPFGSGLLKMMAVGLGKAPGAAQIHRQGPDRMAAAIEELAGVLLARGRILGGLAVVENAYDEVALLEAVPADRIPHRERELYRRAQELLPRLPVDELDVLIVDRMGKDISGTGMDVNVIGRWRLPGVPEPPAPRIRRIVCLRLSAASEGNAQGVGLADVVTRRLVDALDPVATYANAVTSTYLERAFVPVTMPTDRDAIAAALASLATDPRQARVARIRSTAHLEVLWVSEAVLPELRGRPDIEVGEPVPLAFTDDGILAGVDDG
ncbi:MAG: DUF362 domain-containing protein [Armatimonadota bacterium]|nr:DUF362 domain-containing protein [Armatimonadota bacterium]